jgi:hypothetical protein
MNQPEPGVMDNLKNEIGNIGETIKNASTNVSSKVGEIKANLQSVAENTKTTVDSAIKSLPEGSPSFFALSDYTTMSSEFLESNSYIARFAFILLVVFAFFVLLKLATAVIKYFIGRSSGQVKLIDGMIDATKSQIIEQGMGSTKNIPRSSNQSSGIEFTWAVSLYIEDQVKSVPVYSHIFSKGSTPRYTNGTITTINQGPGLYLKNTNSLIIQMDMINASSPTIIDVPGVPHKKWLNVIIRCKNKIMDVYLNGQVAVSKQLTDIPKQNYGNVYVCNDGGFTGSLSNLWYYDHALTINEIQSLMTNSVNLQMLTPSTVTNTGTDYMGFNWYTSK